jgi:hypothetical protein
MRRLRKIELRKDEDRSRDPFDFRFRLALKKVALFICVCMVAVGAQANDSEKLRLPIRIAKPVESSSQTAKSVYMLPSVVSPSPSKTVGVGVESLSPSSQAAGSASTSSLSSQLKEPIEPELAPVARIGDVPLDFQEGLEASDESQEIALSGFWGFPSPADVFEPVRSSALIDRSVCPSIPWDHPEDFSPTPMPVDPWFHDTETEQTVYDDKHPVPTQRPLIEWGRKWYGSGITPPSETWLGDTNLIQHQLYLYGDYRTGIASGRNAVSTYDNWASRLNLDLDYRFTGTERFHMFMGPLNRATQFTRWERNNDKLEYLDFYNFNPVTGYFEGDIGAMLGGGLGTPSPFELPVSAGLMPLLFQNGVWMEDAVSGVSFAVPARHSRLLNWANYDASFFAIFDQINSPAFGADANAAQGFGTAWFIDAYGGYIETGYAYLNDRVISDRSYHNSTFSFTRRYFDKISNSTRVIVNSGQGLAKNDRTADGVLLLIENSLVSREPFTFVPYFNLFAGWDRPQSVARAGVSGGVLRNTGLNFEIDGLNGHPTLDATGADTAGGSLGFDLIGSNLDRQWVVEATYLTPHGDRAFVKGDEYAFGTRYQFNLSHCTLLRFDAMYGWRENDRDLNGTRIEYRWKF